MTPLQHPEKSLPGATEQRLRTDLQLNDLRYQQLFEFNPDGCLIIDRRGIIREASHAAAALLRRRKEFLLDKPLAFFLAESNKEFYKYLGRLDRGETRECLEICLQPRKAEPVHVHVAVAPIANGEGRPTAFLWLLRDISSRKRAEERLQAERDFANSVIETAEAFILVLDKYGHIVRCNEYLQRMSGYDKETLRGQNWCCLFLAAGDRAAAWKMFMQALLTGITRGGPYGFVTRDGSVRVVAWSARELKSSFGDAPSVLLVGHDMTEIQERQKQILQMERLAAIGQAVTALSHESRNALQRGEACLEILRLRLKDRPEDLELIARVQKAQSDLLRLYEDVRLYAAPIHVERHWCDLGIVWRQAWEQVTAQLPKKKGELIEEMEGVDLRCDADGFRLTQVFRNLLENAFAAGPETVRVTISCRETSLAGHAALRITVRDNGPGLNEEQRRNIFKPFYTTKVKGTGLGTSIARRIVEAHGGHIAVGDNAPPGAEIVIILPRTEI